MLKGSGPCWLGREPEGVLEPVSPGFHFDGMAAMVDMMSERHFSSFLLPVYQVYTHIFKQTSLQSAGRFV